MDTRPVYDHSPDRHADVAHFAPGTPMRAPATRPCPECGADGGDLCDTPTGADHPARV